MQRRSLPARLVGLLVTVLGASVLMLPHAGAQPPFRLSSYVTDQAGALTPAQLSTVQSAVDDLYASKRVRLWVVFVADFSGAESTAWARSTLRTSNIQSSDAILAVATADREYALLVPAATAPTVDVDELRIHRVEPLLRGGDWSGAAVAAANGLHPPATTPRTWLGVVAFLVIVALAVLALVVWQRRRRRRRREAEFAAARRLDPTDPDALATLHLDALDDLSKSIVVEVDNAVRTSDNELALAADEFGEQDTAPFAAAVHGAKATLAQAFTVRQTLDDAVPESPQQRRDLLTRVVDAAARADRALDEQRDAFHALRDLVINAPSRLDALTRQLVDLTARIDPAGRTLTALHTQFTDTALASIAGNVGTAEERLAFADASIATARSLVARPASSQGGLVDAIRAAESALGQARSLLDAVDHAATDINRAVAGLPAAIADLQEGIDGATAALGQDGAPHGRELAAARDAAVGAVTSARANGTADPLGAFVALSRADTALDQLLVTVGEERATAQRLNRAFDQALSVARSRIRGVSDFIDTRRAGVGSEARTKLAEAGRQVDAAQAMRATNLGEAVARANAAADLAAAAQSIADSDVAAAQRSYAGHYGRAGDTGAALGGIIVGNILSGALRGGLGGGGWSSSTFGGSGGGFRGGGGRF